MGVNYYGKDAGEFYLFDTEANLLTLIKCRKKIDCSMCHTIIHSGSYCLGKDWTKTCLRCAPKFLKNFIKSMDKFKSEYTELLKSMEARKSEMEKNNMLASLQGQNK